MKTNTIKKMAFFSSFILVILLLQNCQDTSLPPQPTNEQELITTVKLELKDSVSGQFLNYFFRDLDGEGNNPPSQWDTIKLDTGRIYIAYVKFLNESNPNSILNISSEIKAEQNNHIICYSVVNANSIITRTDNDGTYPLGLETKWFTKSKATGSMTITLKHQPGIKNGSCSPGETDVEVAFPLIIE